MTLDISLLDLLRILRALNDTRTRQSDAVAALGPDRQAFREDLNIELLQLESLILDLNKAISSNSEKI